MAIKANSDAQLKRYAKYVISIRQDGHLTQPTADAGIPEDSYADPVNFAFLMDTPERARAAIRYWGSRKMMQYSEADRAKIETRMKSLAEKAGVSVGFSLVLDEVDVVAPVEFSLENPTPDGELVQRTGKLFEAGEYQDKNFAITEEELDSAVHGFNPVLNNLEHTRTVLDNNLGRVERVERRGKDLFGTVTVPRWLDALLGVNPLKASLEWDRETKQIVGNALVLNPRIPDAQLVAAFTAAKEQPMSLVDKIKALFTGEKSPSEDELKAAFTAEVVIPPVNKAPDKAPDVNPVTVTVKGGLVTDVTPPATFSVEQFAGLQRQLLNAQAEAWFSGLLASGYVFPAEKVLSVALFTEAALSGSASSVCFSEDGTLKEGVLLKVVKASFAARQKHGLTTEQLSNLVTLSNDEEKPDTAKRMANLKAQSRYNTPAAK